MDDNDSVFVLSHKEIIMGVFVSRKIALEYLKKKYENAIVETFPYTPSIIKVHFLCNDGKRIMTICFYLGEFPVVGEIKADNSVYVLTHKNIIVGVFNSWETAIICTKETYGKAEIVTDIYNSERFNVIFNDSTGHISVTISFKLRRKIIQKGENAQ